ncbi:hypothetical protein [Streptomyces sp. NPDC006333]|uniref:hypothetical protein n=1 Tax=Streptomyces sp. NPDC006333 TaxID=3156753 RepID=UPI0033B18BE7
MVGKVTLERYAQLVAESKRWSRPYATRISKLGDNALKIEPLQSKGGASAALGEDVQSVEETLRRFADDVGVSKGSVMGYRFTAAY